MGLANRDRVSRGTAGNSEVRGTARVTIDEGGARGMREPKRWCRRDGSPRWSQGLGGLRWS